MLIPPPADGQTRCAVLGSPVAHSLSPLMHRAAYDALGLGWSYDAVEVAESGLAAFVAGLDPTWRGLSLTMPLKRAVMPLLDHVSPVAGIAGAANTVVVAADGLHGDNTDVPGSAAALRERYDGPVADVVVAGGGATAASVLLAVADLGCVRGRLLVRTPARATETLAALARHPRGLEVTVAGLADPVGRADVVVSTVPGTAQTPDLVERLLDARPAAVFDVAYDPWPTPLTTAARGHAVVVHGLDLLAHQAALQVRLMTGHDVAVALLRDAALRAVRGG